MSKINCVIDEQDLILYFNVSDSVFCDYDNKTKERFLKNKYLMADIKSKSNTT